MKKYRVTWNEVRLCAREVFAPSEEKALEIVQDDEFSGKVCPDENTFGGYEYWEVCAVEK